MRFQTVMAGVCALMLSLASMSFAGEVQTAGPAIFVRGLVMVGVDDRDSLKIAVPDAGGHNATITIVSKNGEKRVLPLAKSQAILTGFTPSASTPVVRVPELVRTKELYGAGVGRRLDDVRTMISIPWSSVAEVTTEKVTTDRYTFVRTDRNEEIDTFRPRQIAESIRIDLASTGNLKFRNNATVEFGDAKEVWIEYLPKDPTANVYEEHFHHYLHYLVLPDGKNFQVQPTKLSGAQARMPRLRMGNAFFPPYYACYLLGI
jgi:hypothetical protein